jgi:hypothetical protein
MSSRISPHGLAHAAVLVQHLLGLLASRQSVREQLLQQRASMYSASACVAPGVSALGALVLDLLGQGFGILGLVITLFEADQIAARKRATRQVIQVIMPYLAPVWISEVMRKVLLSRMSDADAGVAIMISKAATRPGLSMRGQQQLGDHRLQAGASWVRTCSCWLVGKASTMRSTVRAAPVVCRVAKTRWPVSAARDGRLHGLQVAHFAHQDHVRVLRRPRAGPR